VKEREPSEVPQTITRKAPKNAERCSIVWEYSHMPVSVYFTAVAIMLTHHREKRSRLF
jgi:hypothetical protein